MDENKQTRIGTDPEYTQLAVVAIFTHQLDHHHHLPNTNSMVSEKLCLNLILSV